MIRKSSENTLLKNNKRKIKKKKISKAQKQGKSSKSSSKGLDHLLCNIKSFKYFTNLNLISITLFYFLTKTDLEHNENRFFTYKNKFLSEIKIFVKKM